MKIQLTNPKYSYLKDGLTNLTCTIEIVDETTDTVLWSENYSVTLNLGNSNSIASAKDKIKNEAVAAWDRFQWIINQVNTLFGTTDFDTAINNMMTDLENDINTTIGA